MRDSMKNQLSELFNKKLKNLNVKKYVKDIKGAWRFNVGGNTHYFKSATNKDTNTELTKYYTEMVNTYKELLNRYE